MTDQTSFLSRLYENLNILQEREAKYGGNPPIELYNQIRDHHAAIELTKQAIAGELTTAEWEKALQPLLVAIADRSGEATSSVTIENVGGIHRTIIAGRDVIINNLTDAQLGYLKNIIFGGAVFGAILVTFTIYQLEFWDTIPLFPFPVRILFAILGLLLIVIGYIISKKQLPYNRLRKGVFYIVLIPIGLFCIAYLCIDVFRIGFVYLSPELIYDENNVETFEDASWTFLVRGQWYLRIGEYEKAADDLNRSKDIGSMAYIEEYGEPAAWSKAEDESEYITSDQRRVIHWLLYLSLDALNVNGIDLSPRSDIKHVEVLPGQRIKGDGVLSMYLDSTSRLIITPIALTTSWDNSFRTEIDNGLEFAQAREFGPLERTYAFHFDVNASSQPGVYYIIIIAGAVYNINQALTFNYLQHTGTNDIWHIPVEFWRGQTYGGHIDHSFTNAEGEVELYSWPIIAIEVEVLDTED